MLQKMFKLEDVVGDRTSAIETPPEAIWVWGEASSSWTTFCKFLEKNSYFNVI